MDQAQIFVDQLKRSIEFKETPQRIVSLVPSQTELLWYLGLEDSLVGVTKYCIHPKHLLKEKLNVGGTKNVNFNILKEINPDIIIANKEENTQSEIEELVKTYPVWITDIVNLEDSFQMIDDFGRLFKKESVASSLINEIGTGFDNLKNQSLNEPKRVLYFIWRKPYMVAGNGTFINSMLKRCGLENALDHKFDDERYVTLSQDQIKNLSPDYVFLSSEPFPFKKRHFAEMEEICPNSVIVEVDGEMFSWYGSRLKYAPTYFTKLLKTLQN